MPVEPENDDDLDEFASGTTEHTPGTNEMTDEEIATALGKEVTPAATVETPATEESTETETPETPAEEPPAAPEPTDPNVAPKKGGSQPAPTDQAPAAPSLLAYAAQFGVDLGQVQTDEDAWTQLMGLARRAVQPDPYAELGRRLAPHASDIAGFLTQRQAEAAKPKAVDRPAYMPPEFDPAWMSLVKQDDKTGQWIPVENSGPRGVEVAGKVQAYAEWKRQFDANPVAVIEQVAEAKAEAKAKALVEQALNQRFGQHAEQLEIQRTIEADKSWLYLHDPKTGQPVLNRLNQLQPSPEGLLYVKHLQTVAGMGVKGIGPQRQMALYLLDNDILRAQMRSGKIAAPATPTPKPQTRQAGKIPTQGGTRAITHPSRRGLVPGADHDNPKGKSLAQMLTEDFDAEGVTSADFRDSG
jgi:hypothetical protein